MSSRYASEAASPEPLAQPLSFPFSTKTAKNRFLKSAMAENLATWSGSEPSKRGVPTPELVEVYRRWGEGPNNFGVIVTGNIDVEFDYMSSIGDMIITPECKPEGERFEGFKAVAAAGKADGSLMLGQVTHAGRQVQKKIQPNPISASAVVLEPKMGMEFGKPREASKEDINRVIEGFAHAAEYLDKAGFDGIQLHAAHGYLIAQFLSRTTNHRTDEYGVQTLENRTRLIADIGKAIRARTSPDFILSAKLNSVEFQDGGVTPDEARELCAFLSELGFDFLEISGGTYEALGMSWTKESTRKREGFFLEFAETVVAGLGDRDTRKTKAYIVGGMRTVGAMVKALDIVDGVALGRPGAQEFRIASDILEGRITGAIRPVQMMEDDFGFGLTAAGAHIRQVSKGQEPFDSSDLAATGTFASDMQAWYQDMIADGDKLEHHGGVDFSGKTVPYGAVTAAQAPTKVSELESRLASIEKQLQQALDANRQHSNQTSTQPSTAPSSTESINGRGQSAESIEFVDQVSSSESPSEWVTEPEKPKLPPLEEIMPIIDEFFNRYNCVMPLFDPPTFMRMLSNCYFTAMVMTHGIYSHDADWVRRISSYSQMTIKDLDSSPSSSCGHQNPPLPLGWAKCAELSRSCMKLFVESPKTDCSIWSNSCAHFSGLIILLANMFVFPDHPHLMTDNELANQALRLFELMLSMKSYEDYESFHRLHEVVKELHRRALEAVEEVTRKQKERAEAAAAAASAMDTGLPFGAQLEDEVEFFRDAEAAGLEGPFVGTFVPASPFATTSWGLEGLQSEDSKPSSDRKHVTSRSLAQSASQISLPTLLMRIPRPLYRQSTISSLLRKPIQTRSFSQSVKDMADYKLKAVSSLSLRPGDKQEVEVEGIEGAKVLLVNAGGKIQAVGPKCTHFGAPLVKGVLTTSGRLTCPWHGACFNTKTGDVEDAPALDSIPVFNVTERDGAVYITGEESAIKSGRRKPNFKCNVVSGTQEEKVVIVGGGSGALGAVEALRNGGYQGPLTIISAEGYLPIDRTKLSKALLTDVNALQWRDKAWYESGSVDWVDDEVTDVDFSDRKVSTSGGKTLPYTKLILATGGTPRNLPLQGFKVLGNIFTLRTAHDTQKIVKAIGEKGKKIVIVGSSFIGMEVANATAKDNDVTVIGMEKVPLERVLGEKVGAGIQKSLEKNGVKFHMNAGVEKAEPSGSDPSNVGAVHLKDGTKLEADLVILGVGVAPATEFLKENKVIRLEQDGSIKTDENFLVVGLKDVYAIGDIATYPYHGPGGDGRYTRIEHWNVAQNAGRTVASNIINAAVQPARFIPVFWSALGSQLRYCGNTIGGWDDVVIQGSVEESSFVAYYTKGDTVVAMASMGKDPAMVQSAELMALGKMPSKKQLADGLDITTIGPLEA
ncbi:NADH-dependent flavin oxidoreductase nadA [Colletotrichum sp. SAR 10_70]|nr:NADH-dependent flavin oxidoreductase nadA [Colletotrichum sp. SAR 10_70]KAI8161783.1 NADH-dependent flavin oxidoreductase nadA [Colletotrichum sp. SAR 10_71]KAI8180618.1 NADH-dependent flavin oxidoreductase nadA [Colletotrichum sp. SAR 10_75]KAI8184766.1 NADH-dependent flavin oxidoreductase nadA [Colletotrichum sp. SAR 10_65]KAI8220503.1 NADH-dependent flavin oxidoreductase nadA [Colletotrichum sp. SAR 10_77]KAI8230422.1 NADH-dependent flavin oxidoreductase nadA [Colletotrichum sp. SAR 10_8